MKRLLLASAFFISQLYISSAHAAAVAGIDLCLEATELFITLATECAELDEECEKSLVACEDAREKCARAKNSVDVIAGAPNTPSQQTALTRAQARAAEACAAQDIACDQHEANRSLKKLTCWAADQAEKAKNLICK